MLFFKDLLWSSVAFAPENGCVAACNPETRWQAADMQAPFWLDIKNSKDFTSRHSRTRNSADHWEVLLEGKGKVQKV